MEDIQNSIGLKNELLRKSIHLSSSAIPLSYLFIERNVEIIILCVLTLTMMLIDLGRFRKGWFKDLYLKVLGPVLRKHEIDSVKFIFTGGTYLILAYLACVVIFPKPLAITSMFVVIICDTMAAVIGKVYGKHYIKNKTLEGSAAFLISGIIIILLSPKITNLIAEFYVGILSITLTAAFELIPNKIDDNISIPLFFGFVYLILLKIFI